VAYVYNPSYSRGEEWENHGLRPAQAKKLARSHLRWGLRWAWGCGRRKQGCGGPGWPGENGRKLSRKGGARLHGRCAVRPECRASKAKAVPSLSSVHRAMWTCRFLGRAVGRSPGAAVSPRGSRVEAAVRLASQQHFDGRPVFGQASRGRPRSLRAPPPVVPGLVISVTHARA
jgi:hypothetical protein